MAVRVRAQRWWLGLMLGLVLPSVLGAWIAACGFAEQRLISAAASGGMIVAGAGLVTLRWLSYALMVVRGRAVLELAAHRLSIPPVGLWPCWPRSIAYADITGLRRQRRSGHASELIVVVGGLREIAIPGLFQWDLAKLEQALARQVPAVRGAS